MKKIKVKRLEDDNSVNVRIEHTAKMAATVDKLLELSDSDFRNAIASARKYRRANRKMMKFMDDPKLRITIESKNELSEIVNHMVDLGHEEYKKAVRCAKQYRRANKMLSSAINKYVGLAKEDNEHVQSRMQFEAMGL